MDIDFEAGFFAPFAYVLVHFFANFLDEFFDSGRVDSSVGDESFEGNAGDFAAYGVESGENDGFGGVVDDQVDACCGFECADISALAADNASLHFFAG